MNLKNLKIKIPKISLGQLLGWIPWLVTLLLITCVFASGSFLYKYFYNTVAQAEKIFLLRNEISLSQIDINLYQSVITGLKTKKESDYKELQTISDPFIDGTANNTAPTTNNPQ